MKKEKVQSLNHFRNLCLTNAKDGIEGAELLKENKKCTHLSIVKHKF